MKNLFRKLVLVTLKTMAKYRLKRFHGKIIAVTGSVGKTSTKDAIFCVLNSQFKVRRSKKSMNSEFGLALTILDIDSGFSSAGKWALMLTKAFVHCLSRDHSDILLLELGVDKPGDMDYLTSIVQPDVAVFTNVFPVHLADGQFSDLKDIFDEKAKLVSALKKGGTAVLNTDNAYIADLAKTRGKKGTVTFGKGEEAMYKLGKIQSSLDGIQFILENERKQFRVHADVIGEYQAYVILPAIICGVLIGMSIEKAIAACSRYALPPGRMTIIPAKEGATILDSSYNSSPEAVKSALSILKEVGEGKRKIAVLGSMNELGDESKKLHETVGKNVPEFTDMLISVGDEAKNLAKAAELAGMKNVHHFDDAKKAGDYFSKKIEKNDIILVKGSQNKVRLERFIKMIMANPGDAEKLLVRQEKVWQNKL